MNYDSFADSKKQLDIHTNFIAGRVAEHAMADATSEYGFDYVVVTTVNRKEVWADLMKSNACDYDSHMETVTLPTSDIFLYDDEWAELISKVRAAKMERFRKRAEEEDASDRAADLEQLARLKEQYETTD